MVEPSPSRWVCAGDVSNVVIELQGDPWRSDYGPDVEFRFDEPDDLDPLRVLVDPHVETDDWSVPLPPSDSLPEPPLLLIDGVRRVDMRVLARDEDRLAWGIFGVYGVGMVKCDGVAQIQDESISRSLIIGSGIVAPDISLDIRETTLLYSGHGIDSTDPDHPLRELQNLMRKAEGDLASQAALSSVILVDGPLHYPHGPDRTVVGVVKRMVFPYLTREHAHLLTVLEPGQRTPLFALGRQVLDRYAWYQRLIPRRPPWHIYSGLVRCEVRMSAGLYPSIETANQLAFMLPKYAGRAGVDPRAPQNLAPVGALEAHLRRRLGNRTIVRRAIETLLFERVVS